MEPKYLFEEVIIHPNHHLTFGEPGSLGYMKYRLWNPATAWQKSKTQIQGCPDANGQDPCHFHYNWMCGNTESRGVKEDKVPYFR